MSLPAPFTWSAPPASTLALPATPTSPMSTDVADAGMKRDTAAIRAMMQRHADVNVPQNDGTTALMWAARYDDVDAADLLIRAGAKVSVSNRDGATALQLAAINGSTAMLEKLIKAGADPNAPLSATGDTALMLAAR